MKRELPSKHETKQQEADIALSHVLYITSRPPINGCNTFGTRTVISSF